MTGFKDNIYTGNIATTSATSSLSPVRCSRTHNFNAVGGTTAITQNGVFPPNAQNLAASIYIIQNASATVSDKVIVSAGGKDLLTIDQFGSAGGYAAGTTTSVARFTIVASACANLTAPSPSNNGGEIPYAITFLPVSADKTGQYQVHLSFNRADTTWGPQGPYVAPSSV